MGRRSAVRAAFFLNRATVRDETTALNHKIFYRAVETKPVEEVFFDEFFEVFDRNRRDVFVKIKVYVSAVRKLNLNF